MALLQGFNAATTPPMDSIEPVPAGDYRAMIIESEFKETASKAGQYLNIEFELLDDPYKGRKLWSRLNLIHTNTKTVEIAQKELSSICRAVGVLQPNDSSELHGRPMMVRVCIEKRSDNGEPANRIKGYKPIEALVTPQAVAPGTPASTAVAPTAPPPAAIPTPGVPPWRQPSK